MNEISNAMPFLFFHAEPYINMLLRSVQHMGHSNALKKKFYLTLIPIFNLYLQHLHGERREMEEPEGVRQGRVQVWSVGSLWSLGRWGQLQSEGNFIM